MVTTLEVETLQRSFRAKQIARRQNAVKSLGNGLYLVESQYRPGEFYRVNLTAEHTCHCEDYRRRQPAPCKHILAAENADKASKRRRVVIDDWDGQTGKVSAWHYAPTAAPAAPANAAETERQERIAKAEQIADELFPF